MSANVEESRITSLLPQAFAQKMAAARENWSLDGERRIVTILFCDLVGSTAAAGELDPENWAEIVNIAFEHMIQPIYMYEGTVARLMGDAILAFFGAPVAHEDDPERAVRAGLEIIRRYRSFSREMQAQWGIEIDARVGINTGLVLVGQVGSDLQMEYTAIGDAINLASRMEQTAAPGTVQIAEETYRLTGDLFDVEDLGKLQVKGKTEPVRSYRVLGEHARVERRGLSGRTASLIGREEEWQSLKKAATANLKGVGQIVYLLGEAGLGKTRLIRELHRECHSQADKLQNGKPVHLSWHETASLSYEKAMPYALFQRLLRGMMGVSPGVSQEILRSQFSHLESYFPTDERVRVRQVLESLFNLENQEGLPRLEGEAFRGQFYTMMSGMLTAMAVEGPLVLVFDDLHWMDPASAGLVRHLLDLMNSVPILLLCASRPERDAPAWDLKEFAKDEFRHRYTEIELKPLTETESEHLVDELLNIDDLPQLLKTKVLQRAEGNPFFVEEVVRSLIEDGHVVYGEAGGRWIGEEDDHFDIPENVQSLLTARIDRLPEESRRVLQLAALIGRTFYYRILAAIIDESKGITLDHELDTLQRAAFIRESARNPELEFVFQHMLTQEAAYHTILHQHRRQYHRLVGEVMESLFPDKVDEHAIHLARHFFEGQVYDRSFHYSLVAGNAAMRLFAAAEAIRHFDYARQLLGNKLPIDALDREEIRDLYRKRGRALELVYRFSEALDNYRELAALARKLEDRSLELTALMLEGTVRSIPSDQYEPVLATELSEQALALAAELDDQVAMARIYWNMLILYRNRGMGRQSLLAGEKSLALAKENGLREQIAFTSNDLAYVYLMNNMRDRGIEVAKEASQLWAELGNQPMLADSLAALANFQMLSGNIQEAIEISDRSHAISEKIRNLWGQSHSRYMIGGAHWALGDIGRAIDSMETAAVMGDRSGFIIGQIWSRCTHAMLLIELGLFDEALEKLAEAEVRPVLISEYLPFIHAMHAYVNSVRGEETEIISYHYESEVGPGLFSAPYIERMRAMRLVARGRPEDALANLERLLANQYMAQLALLTYSTRYDLSVILRKVDREEEAVDMLAALLEDCDATGSRWLRWRVCLDLSELLKNEEEQRALREKAAADADWISDHLPGDPVRKAVLDLFAQRDLQPAPVKTTPE